MEYRVKKGIVYDSFDYDNSLESKNQGIIQRLVKNNPRLLKSVFEIIEDDSKKRTATEAKTTTDISAGLQAESESESKPENIQPKSKKPLKKESGKL